jgi:hypothetical protein
MKYFDGWDMGRSNVDQAKQNGNVCAILIRGTLYTAEYSDTMLKSLFWICQERN